MNHLDRLKGILPLCVDVKTKDAPLILSDGAGGIHSPRSHKTLNFPDFLIIYEVANLNRFFAGSWIFQLPETSQ